MNRTGSEGEISMEDIFMSIQSREAFSFLQPPPQNVSCQPHSLIWLFSTLWTLSVSDENLCWEVSSLRCLANRWASFILKTSCNLASPLMLALLIIVLKIEVQLNRHGCKAPADKYKITCHPINWDLSLQAFDCCKLGVSASSCCGVWVELWCWTLLTSFKIIGGHFFVNSVKAH